MRTAWQRLIDRIVDTIGTWFNGNAATAPKLPPKRAKSLSWKRERERRHHGK